MAKKLLIIAFSWVLVNISYAVNEATIKKFEKTQVYKEKQVEVVRFEVIKPDIERYQKKTKTNLNTGYVQMYKTNIRKSNKVLLNKWLKEFK